MRIINDVLRMDGHTIWSVPPDAPVINAIKLMAEKQVGALPVLRKGKLVGIISAKDCINKVIIKGKSPEETRVSKIMARDIIYAEPNQSIEDCLSIMSDKHIRHLPVVANLKMVGFVSMGDLFNAIINEQKDYIYHLENYVSGVEFV